MGRRLGVWGALCMVLLLSGCEQPGSKLQLEAATLLPQPKSLPSFTLQQHDIGEFDEAQLRGKWSLLFFGYTRCPDVCPTELYTLSQLMRSIEKSGADAGKPQVLFISVDGDRDTPEALQEYAGYYHPDFVGVTGANDEVDTVTRALGVIHERVYYQDGKQVVVDDPAQLPESVQQGYLINHSATIFLINPDGKFHAVFSTPHKHEVIQRDLNTMQQAW